MFDNIEQIIEYGVSVQAAAGVGQFNLDAPIGFGQWAAALTGCQVIGCRNPSEPLMLLNMSKLNEPLAGIKRGAGQRRIEHGGTRSASLERQLHQLATYTLALVLITDDHQADGGVISLRTSERGTDQTVCVFYDKTLRDALQHGPVFQAVGPLQLHGQGMGRRHIG